MAKMVIDLSGPQGNSFSLMAIAKDLCKKTGKDSAAMIGKMVSGDYQNIISILKEEFGEHIKVKGEQ